MHRLTAFLVVCVPTLAVAQGRLIVRPCAPPCPPDAACMVERPIPCGARVQKTSSVARVQFADRVLRYEVTEVFHNSGGTVGEADYMFPLPPGSAFEDLKLSINGELVSGETLPADRARGIYEDIVRRQRDPALVEWIGSGMLRARIFPILPGEDKKVVVRFQGVAAREGDALRIDYRTGGDFTFEYPRDAAYGDAYSPTHQLETRDEGGGRTRIVRTHGSSSGGASDLTLLLPLRRADVAGITMLSHAERGEPGFAMLTITPPVSTARATPRDLTFVLDVSGSMQGHKLEQAKAAGHALLQSLRSTDRFRLIDFSTDVHDFRHEWSDASPENLRSARRYLDALNAEGSTNISEALRTALTGMSSGAASSGRLPLVVFVTDGEPTVGERNPDAIAALASRLRGDARVFTVGVGTGVNATLVEQLALQGHGTAHFVRDEESVEAPVSLLARRLAEPLLTDVRISVDGVRWSRQVPNGAIDVFAGQDLIVLGRYEGNGDATVRLEGRSPGGRVSWTTHARLTDDNRANPFVARIWAAQRIGWLAAEKRRNGNGRSELDEEIRTLGERFGIPTEFSSYLVVEPGMAIATNGPQPVPSAAPMPSSRRPQYASAAASAPASAGMAFEAARGAAVQRDAKSVAALDSMTVREGRSDRAAVRVIGNRRLSLANGVWIDARFTPGMRMVRVRPYSPLYFEMLRRLPELTDVFALGDRVRVAGRAVAIELAPDGDERIDAALLSALKRDW